VDPEAPEHAALKTVLRRRGCWAVLSTLLAGIVVWGGIGWLIDLWLHHVVGIVSGCWSASPVRSTWIIRSTATESAIEPSAFRVDRSH